MSRPPKDARQAARSAAQLNNVLSIMAKPRRIKTQRSSNVGKVTCQCGNHFDIAEVEPLLDFNVSEFKKRGIKTLFRGRTLRCPRCGSPVDVNSGFATPQDHTGGQENN